MTIDEMIEVLKAYKEGKPIEVNMGTENAWAISDNPAFNFGSYDYRVAKPKPKKVKFLAYKCGVELRWLESDVIPAKIWVRIPLLDIEAEVEE